MASLGFVSALSVQDLVHFHPCRFASDPGCSYSPNTSARLCEAELGDAARHVPRPRLSGLYKGKGQLAINIDSSGLGVRRMSNE